MKDSEIIIAGAGVVGLVAALGMAHRGYQVVILDAKPLPAELETQADPRVFAINHASEQLLRKLDVWCLLAQERLAPYTHMHVWDGRTNAAIDFDRRDIGTKNLGYIIEESVLKSALLKKIALNSAIELYPEHPVTTITTQPKLKVISGEDIWTGNLLMVADGAQSQARAQLEVKLTTWSYAQQAIVATMATEKPHNDTAYQVFHPDGPLAFLPLANPHESSIVWSLDSIKAEDYYALSPAEFCQKVEHFFASKLGTLKLVSPRYKFPLQMRHAQQYIGEQWMLLGDAAHTIHPLAGLGLNLGLADVATWLNCIDAQKNKNNLRKALASYQRQRKSEVWHVIAAMEGFKRLFGSTSLPSIGLRSLGLSLCNRSSLLKQFFIHQARG
ncbi:MAG: 2-polyprenyl-6-methoxyphenol hydroxylase [Legionella sp. 40-6]|nr:FAD-dependent monooxygenase [Legionella sp.]OJX87846.1 MAG: 2-polyprenyl-6-methoxyphenol hydroxylase [Legionella sp. 40-6]